MNKPLASISPKIESLSDDQLLAELKAFKLPKIKDLTRTLKYLKKSIGDEYRADWCENDTVPSMDITIGSNINGNWDIQTGDNSYYGNAYGYPFWAVSTLRRRSNTVALARDIRYQLSEAIVGFDNR
jgi:hypothetical protein